MSVLSQQADVARQAAKTPGAWMIKCSREFGTDTLSSIPGNVIRRATQLDSVITPSRRAGREGCGQQKDADGFGCHEHNLTP